jgi:FkbM family methyltransferase
LKNTAKYILQTLFGYERYLYYFALFKIKTLRKDQKECDFFQFMSFLQDGQGDILDVGANIGIMTVHLAQKFPNTTIHAFEPIPSNIAVLKRIIQKFDLKNVILHEFALGDSIGKAQMVVPELSKAKQQGLSHVKHESITELNDGETFTVDIKTLDSVLLNTKVQGIKIDVENFEYFALKGAAEMLKHSKPIVYAELWDNENRSNCFELLSAMQYNNYIVEDEQLVLYDSNIHKKQNFIFR